MFGSSSVFIPLSVFVYYPVCNTIFVHYPVCNTIFVYYPVCNTIFVYYPVYNTIFVYYPVCNTIFECKNVEDLLLILLYDLLILNHLKIDVI